MKEQIKDCCPTICNKNDLMTNWWEFMDRDGIKERCIQCTKQEVCIRIVDLLLANRVDNALDLLTYTDVPKKFKDYVPEKR